MIVSRVLEMDEEKSVLLNRVGVNLLEISTKSSARGRFSENRRINKPSTNATATEQLLLGQQHRTETTIGSNRWSDVT